MIFKKIASYSTPLFLLVFSFFSNAQSPLLNNSAFEVYSGQWEGQLEYLNYQDDKTMITIPCHLNTDFKKNKLMTEVIFDELNKKGQKMKSKDSFRISRNGRFLKTGKVKWKITSTEKDKNQLKIIASRKGKDNNKPSDFRMTLIAEKEKSISWTKDVKYKGSNQFFNRNQFSFIYKK